MTTRELIGKIFANIDDNEILNDCLEKIKHNSDCHKFGKYVSKIMEDHCVYGMQNDCVYGVEKAGHEKYKTVACKIFLCLFDYGGFGDAKHLVMNNLRIFVKACPEYADELCIKIAAKNPNEKFSDVVVTPNFMSRGIVYIYNSSLPIFKKNIHGYMEKNNIGLLNLIEALLDEIQRNFDRCYWWEKKTNRIDNLKYLLSLVEDKKILMETLVPSILKLYYLDCMAKSGTVCEIIKRENIISNHIFGLCVKYVDIESVYYLLDKKCSFDSKMIDEIFVELDMPNKQSVSDFPKRVGEMLNLAMNNMIFTENHLVLIAAFDLMPPDKITNVTIPDNIKSLFRRESEIKNLEELLSNCDTKLSELRKIVKKTDKISAKNFVHALCDELKSAIINYLLDCDTDVTIECISMIKNKVKNKKIPCDILKKAVLKYITNRANKNNDGAQNIANLDDNQNIIEKEELPVKKMIKKRNKNVALKCDMKNDNA